MTLVVFELYDTRYQEITVGLHDIQLVAIRPHILRFASPAGSLQITVRDSLGGLVATSDVVAISAIGSGNYWHGYQRFLITAQLKAGTVYRIQLEAVSGYSFSEAAYIGWCNDYDLRKVTATYSPNTGGDAPLDLELWEMVDQWRRAA